MDDFLNMERGGKEDTFLERLAYLKAAIACHGETIEDLQPAVERILARKGGVNGEVLALAKELSNLTSGFSPDSNT